MKIAVYAIALDEAANVEAWAESAKDADYLLLADTGSTDGTKDLARAAGVQVIDVHVDPFRFDMARNAALAALPPDADWCIAFDLDERLQPGWREALEKVPNDVTVARFLFIGSWFDDGRPQTGYWRGDCHRRSGFIWQHMVHEHVTPYGPTPVKMADVPGFEVFQYFDADKKRSDKYIDLLRMELDVDPTSVHASRWLQRTLTRRGRDEEAAAEAKRFAEIEGTWPAARAEAMFQVSLYGQLDRLYWLERAAATLPEHREPALRLASYHLEREEYEPMLRWAEVALAVTEPCNDGFDQEWAWGYLPHEYLSLALHGLGRIEEAAAAAEDALATDPRNPDLRDNLKMLKDELAHMTEGHHHDHEHEHAHG